MIRFILFAMLLWVLPFQTVLADEYRPAYLELRQTDDDLFQVLWKVPARGDQKLDLDVKFPSDVAIAIPASSTFVGGAFVERWTISRSGGLTGANISIAGLEKISTDVLVRIERLDGSSETKRLNAASKSFDVKGTAQFLDVLKTYLVFGIEHILTGNDHLLFVACLIFIAGSWHRILVTISGFTVAHSITLTLAALEYVRIPVPPIEATIALSIMFLAREIAMDRRDTLTWRFPVAVSASFGLLHGFGFASALSDIGLPQTEIPTSLLAFNIGVEIGQILFVAGLLGLFGLIVKGLKWFKIAPVNWLSVLSKPISFSVGGIAAYWTIDRIVGFWV